MVVLIRPPLKHPPTFSHPTALNGKMRRRSDGRPQSMRNRGALVGTHRPGSPHRATLDSHTGLAPIHDWGPTTRTRHARPKRTRFRGRTLSLRQHRVELTNRLCFAYDSIYLILRFLLGPKDRFHRDGFPCPEMNRSVFVAMIVTPFHKLFG